MLSRFFIITADRVGALIVLALNGAGAAQVVGVALARRAIM